MEGHTQQAVLGAAERIRADIENLRVPCRNKTLHVTASLGVGYAPAGSDPSMALNTADEALREAKEAGRNRVVLKMTD